MTKTNLQPKLSIITVNLNNAAGLRKTIESVVSQTFTDYEYIIIDGGSTDGSVEVIKEFADKITYWVSEPDTGIYNAMNKGILQAKGEYCLFLNSGDWLLSKVALNKVFSINHKEDLICCKVFKHKNYGINLIQLPKVKLTLYDFYTATLAHPSTFIKTSLLIDNGLYDEKLTIVADWKFFTEVVIIHRCSYITLDLEITYFAPGGISSDERNQIIHRQERKTVLMGYYPMMYDDYLSISTLENEIMVYRNSRLIQLVRKMQESKLYKLFKFN